MDSASILKYEGAFINGALRTFVLTSTLCFRSNRRKQQHFYGVLVSMNKLEQVNLSAARCFTVPVRSAP